MEALGVAVGVAGLAGLYSSLLEVAKQVDNYLKYDTDEAQLSVQFNAVHIRLARWGRAVQIDPQGNPPLGKTLSGEVYQRDEIDEGTAIAVKELLEAANEILHAQDSGHNGGAVNGLPSHIHAQLRTSKRKRLGWSLRGKLNRVEQVRTFAFIVQRLHDLVPLPCDRLIEVGNVASDIARGTFSKLASKCLLTSLRCEPQLRTVGKDS